MKHKLVILSLVLANASVFAHGRGAADLPRRALDSSAVAAANAALPQKSNAQTLAVPAPKALTQQVTAPTPTVLGNELARATKIVLIVTGDAKAFYTQNPLDKDLENLRTILTNMQKDTEFQTWLGLGTNTAGFKTEVQRAWPKEHFLSGFFFLFKSDNRPNWVKKLVP